MDRAEAIVQLEVMATNLAGEYISERSNKRAQYIKKKADALDMAIAALREQEQSKWISVDERLPEYERSVLVTDVRDGYISISALSEGVIGWSDYWECEDTLRLSVSEITHWMPLPEPPKEGAEE